MKNYCQSQALIGLGIFSYRMSNWIQFTFWGYTFDPQGNPLDRTSWQAYKRFGRLDTNEKY